MTSYQFLALLLVAADSSHIFYLSPVVAWIFWGVLWEGMEIAMCKQWFPRLPLPIQHLEMHWALTGGEEGFCKCHQHFNQQEQSGEGQSGGVDSAPCFCLGTFCDCRINLFFFTFLPVTRGYGHFVKSCLGICKQELPNVNYYYKLFLAGCCLELLINPATLYDEEMKSKTSTSPKALIKPNV